MIQLRITYAVYMVLSLNQYMKLIIQKVLHKDVNYTHYKPHTWMSIQTFTHNSNWTATGKISCISEPLQYKNDAGCTPFMHIDKINTM